VSGSLHPRQAGTGRPRVLVVMGSGEVAPTMAKVHRALLDRLPDTRVAIIDTPYGFQENADELSSRMVEFFATNVGREATVASYRSRDIDAVDQATAVARIREAGYVMAGPGSPSYALRQWIGGPIPEVLGSKLEVGGILTMASAAALTLGVVTVPVYEIYKVGDAPRWLDGLDLLGRATGLRAAVIPHYDNAEGGTHDTRFCYLGERRLRILEAELPAGTFVLGVDSHTALLLDLDGARASVAGLGGVTVRVNGQSVELPAGADVPIARLATIAKELRAGETVELDDGAPGPGPGGRPSSSGAQVHLRDAMAHLEGSFVEALDRGDAHGAVAALLDLDEEISARIRAGEDSPDLDNARATFRSLIARLGERRGAGPAEIEQTLRPYVDTLLELRGRARADEDWSTADLIRDRLTAAGVEVHDDGAVSSWAVRAPPSD
jgi:hypothetical protein